ncbi:class I SAM-dependent DNA methyltransferase [Nocardia africana]|uniref:Malonyl-CoA O-methyltransferase BioC n=1 Tax=Nocardia africana TaxID=134964 RepID=A0A378WTL8_9NOCA|nr:class I SAM-dependent methyltransferase [Nocardia africana]SUA43683.1 Malonyl-CoA O-methyltransferase BioC [Nocardia africana]
MGPTYDRTVMDDMDLALLNRLRRPNWECGRRAADLGCGTGRTGRWLRERGVAHIDGVDLSEGMLSVARDRGAHTTLTRADVRDSGLPGGTYDLVICSSSMNIYPTWPRSTPKPGAWQRPAAPSSWSATTLSSSW